jgi:hypothetical protein
MVECGSTNHVSHTLGQRDHALGGWVGVKMTPKTASLAAIFGVDFSGTHILVVKSQAPVSEENFSTGPAGNLGNRDLGCMALR